MSLEETLAALVAREVGPLAAQLRALTFELAQLRRLLPVPLVSVTEAAKLLNLDPRTVRRRIADGSLPARRVGGKLLVDMSAVRPEIDPSILHQIPDHR